MDNHEYSLISLIIGVISLFFYWLPLLGAFLGGIALYLGYSTVYEDDANTYFSIVGIVSGTLSLLMFASLYLGLYVFV